MEPLRYVAEAAAAGRSVKSILRRDFGISSSLLSRLKQKDRGILLNDTPVYVTATVSPGDVLTVDISDPPSENSFPPIPMDLDILYEDAYLLVLNKPAGLAVHPSTLDLQDPSLASGLAAYLGGDFTFHPLSRLDRGTTGLMAVAKCGYIHQRLMELLRERHIHREYLGICLGLPEPARGMVELPIGREEGSLIRRCIREDGVYAKSEYELLSRHGEFSLLRLLPHTGRTHQLRLHMAAIGHPLTGDWLYGQEDRALIPRPALHSARLTLPHPITGETLTFTAPLPEDMRRLLK